MQDESYYPFGGKIEYPGADLYNVTATPDRYQYNGKEWNNELGEKVIDYEPATTNYK